MVVFVDTMSLEFGAATGATSETVTNIEKFIWGETPEVSLRPITVMNTVAPLAFKEGHRWIEGEIHVKSEMKDALHDNGTGNVDYLPAGLASPACPWFVMTITDHAAGAHTVTMTGLKFTSERLVTGHGEEGITIVKFVAISQVTT